MSFGRHAYRHVIQPSSTPFIDHVWLSEELLTATFRRFANCQRRYESRAPGPLEARKRLTKRRNTALAGITGPGPIDDVAYLFGRDGREHMKWTNGQGRSAAREYNNIDSHAPSPNPITSPAFSPNKHLNSLDLGTPVLEKIETVTRSSQDIGQQLRKYQTTAALREAVHRLNVDLQREPEYSRLIFDHLLSRSARNRPAIDELVLFLDDPYLNVRGAGNYLAVVKYHVSHGMSFGKQRVLLDVVIRALEVGLIPSHEICEIIKALSTVDTRYNGIKKRGGSLPTRFYREIWDAIGRCDIYQHKDLDTAVTDTWLGVLLEKGTRNDFLLAKEIIMSLDAAIMNKDLWIPKFIIAWLEAPHFQFDHKFANGLLNSDMIIDITEFLVLSNKTHLFEKWQGCLSKLQDVSVDSPLVTWTNIQIQRDVASNISGLSPQHQIILRLWILRTLSTAEGVSATPVWMRNLSASDPIVINLFNLYEFTRDDITEDFLSSLMKGVYDLGLPSSGLLVLAVDLRARNSITKRTRQTLQNFEYLPVSSIPFSDIFAQIHSYNAAAPLFFSNFEKLVREIDVTSPSFLEHAIHLARTGDANRVWTIMRLLRSHTPLKIALGMSWQEIPHPSDKALVRYYPEPRTATCPDPHAALEMIHLLAVAVACSKQLTTRRAFKLVRWLYVFLLKHNAPVRPALARALYHAGVVRFRREGLRVAQAQYNYIWEVVEGAEGAETVEFLRNQRLPNIF